MIFCIKIAALWWGIAFANAAKGTLLGLLGAGILIFLIYRRSSIKWLITQLLVIISGFFIYLFLFIPFTTFTYPTNSILGRWPLWQQAVHLILAHPLLGAGPMHYSYYMNPIAAHPHNSLLLIASEWGIPVLVLVLVLFFWGLKSWIKRQDSRLRGNDRILSFALTASLIAASIHSLVSGILVMPLSQVMLCIIVGWMLGVYYAD